MRCVAGVHAQREDHPRVRDEFGIVEASNSTRCGVFINVIHKRVVAAVAFFANNFYAIDLSKFCKVLHKLVLAHQVGVKAADKDGTLASERVLGSYLEVV